MLRLSILAILTYVLNILNKRMVDISVIFIHVMHLYQPSDFLEKKNQNTK